MTISPEYRERIQQRLSLCDYIAREVSLTWVSDRLSVGLCPWCRIGEIYVMADRQYLCATPRDLLGKPTDEKITELRRRFMDAVASGILRVDPTFRERTIPCGAAGDLIGWTMRIRNVTYRDAFELLADEAEIEWPEQPDDAGESKGESK